MVFAGLWTASGFTELQDPIAVRIATARKNASADQKSVDATLELALALYRRGRDTGDPASFSEADMSVSRALVLAPTSIEALKLRVAILLGQSDFTGALKLAKELNRKTPDDTVIWARLADAYIALGDYDEAEKACQWILDLRPGSTIGFVQGAALREIFGDVEGANEFYASALVRTPISDMDERCWLTTRNARFLITSGNLKGAGELLDQAIAMNPSSQFAKKTQAMLKASQGKPAEAIELERHLLPNAENLFHLALFLEQNSQKQEAEEAFQSFESKAKSSGASRNLVLYYADHGHSPAKAVVVGSALAATRHDVETLDAYAWALYRSGQFAEAKTQMDRALAPGVRNGEYFCHALQIATAQNDATAVKKYGREILKMDFECEHATH